MTTQQPLEELLQKYYDGSTSPQEEVSLYLALLEEPKDSPYRQDLEVVEHMMMAAAQLSLAGQPKQKAEILTPKKAQKRWRIAPKHIWAAAASLTLLIAIGTAVWQPSPKVGGSWRNAQPIGQEEVDKEMLRAFGLLDDCLSAGSEHYSKAHTTIQEASNLLEASYQQLEPMAYSTPFATPFDIAY